MFWGRWQGTWWVRSAGRYYLGARGPRHRYSQDSCVTEEGSSAMCVCCQGAAESPRLCCRSALLSKAHPHKQGCLAWLGLQDMTPSWMEPSQASEMALNKRVPPMVAGESSPVSLPSQEMGLLCCVWPAVSKASILQKPPRVFNDFSTFPVQIGPPLHITVSNKVSKTSLDMGGKLLEPQPQCCFGFD